jgi:hypothetical protein
MKLFGKKQWILSITSLVVGLFLSAYLLQEQFNELNLWIIALTGVIGLSIIIIIGRYSNSK